jgi:murein hydrolase activator
LRPLLALLAALLLALAVPAPPAFAANEKEELNALRQRLDRLKREAAAAEENRSEVADQLKESESAISNANRRVRELAERQTAVTQELRNTEASIRSLEGDLGSRDRDLSRFVYGRYVAGDHDATRLILSGDDPQRIARDLVYLSYISRAQAGLIQGLRSNVDALKTLAEEVRAKRAEVVELQGRETAERAKLEKERLARKVVLDKLGSQIQSQQKEIQSAQRDEQRLTKLVESIARMLREQEAKRQADLRAQREKAARDAAAARNRPAPRDGQREPPVARVDKVPEAAEGGGVFSSLRGRMRLPVRGELASRFGAARAEGGTSLKGVFIRAQSGAEVRSVAPGRVVFADWMRGFGNLLIVDHSDGYLTIYGNNESLLKQAGDRVKTGDSIATVGASGGNQETGLYFELRHQGRAIDPLGWVGR